MQSKLSVSQVLKEGTKKTIDHIGILLVGLGVLGLACIAGALILFIAGAAVLIFNMQVLAVLLISITGLLYTFGFIYLMFGYIHYTLRVHDAGTAQIADLFLPFNTAFKIIIASCIFSLMVTCGLALLVVPGIYLMMRCGLFAYFILDRNAGITQSLKMSWRVTYGHGWELISLLCLAFMLHLIAGASIIGWIFVVPFVDITKAIVYRRLTHAPEPLMSDSL